MTPHDRSDTMRTYGILIHVKKSVRANSTRLHSDIADVGRMLNFAALHSRDPSDRFIA